MSSLFAQVWFWALLAFLIGALLTWVLLVRPAQQRARILEQQKQEQSSRSAAARTQERERGTDYGQAAAPAPAAWPAEPEQQQPAGGTAERTRWLESDSMAGGAAGTAAHEDYDAIEEYRRREEQEFRDEQGYSQAGQGQAADQGYPTDQGYATDQAYGAEQGYASDQGYREDQAYREEQGYPEEQPYAGEQGYEHGYAEQQPYEEQAYAGERPQADEQGYPEEGAYAGGEGYPREETSYGDDYADGEQVAEQQPEDQRQAGRQDSELSGSSLFEPVAEEQEVDERGPLEVALNPDRQGALAERTDEQAAGESRFVEQRPEQPYQDEYPAEYPDEQQAEQVEQQPDAATQTEAEPTEAAPAGEGDALLPKRQRGASNRIRGGFEPPRPIQPSVRSVVRRSPQPEVMSSGSLFEPASAESEGGVAPGPFGPGSAMPLPGGGRPSPDFTVKASVTALRYCSEDSPQYPRMVAEVWFASPADAERVGFRPLT